MKILSFTSCRLKSLVVALGMVCLAQQGMATTIFNWYSTDYVTDYRAIVATPTTSTGVTNYTYSTTTPKSPTPVLSGTSNYNGPTFYGAFSVTSGDGTGTPNFTPGSFGVATSGTSDQLRFSATSSSTSTVRMRGLVFFDQSSFVGSASSGKVTLASDSPISIKLSSSTGGTGGRQVKVAVYALVGSEWGWYLSLGSGAGSGSAFEIADPTAAKWGLYSIDESTTTLNAAPGVSSYTTLGSAFTEIKHVGFFFDYLSATNASATMYLSTFQFNGNVAIPEPSMAMLWLGGAVMLVSYRKFARRR